MKLIIKGKHMLELYRGLIDIFVNHNESITTNLRSHIRNFNDGKTDSHSLGVPGFWNLLLEITMAIFVRICSFAGIILIASLAILFFPLYAFMKGVYSILDHRATPFPPEMIEPTEVKNA
jgi:uncharacterized membrane protein